MVYIKALAGFLVPFLIIDSVWIGIFVEPLYRRQLGQMVADSFDIVPGVMFYLMYAAGTIFLAVRPALQAGVGRTALLNGAAAGAMAYGTYALTNYVILDGWTLVLVVSDILWGTFLTGTCAWLAFLVAGQTVPADSS